jgi:hypothetical protein
MVRGLLVGVGVLLATVWFAELRVERRCGYSPSRCSAARCSARSA